MIAALPVRGERLSWAAGLLSYVSGVLTGALVLVGVILMVVHLVGTLSPALAGAYALLAAVLVTARGSRTAIGSLWRVPYGWARFGRVLYGWLFGFFLGLGVVVAISTIGFVAVLAWALTGPGTAATLVSALAFAAGRQGSFLMIACGAALKREHPANLVEQGAAFAGRLAVLEAVLLVIVGWELLGGV